MLDITPRALGILMAYVLPGAAALFGLSYWSALGARVVQTFLGEASNISLLILVGLASLTVGLLIHVLRWLIFEELPGRFYATWRLPKVPQDVLQDEARLGLFMGTVYGTYQYHQFFGGMVIALPIVFIGWLKSQQFGLVAFLLWFVAFLGFLIGLTFASVRAYKQYRDAIAGLTTNRNGGE